MLCESVSIAVQSLLSRQLADHSQSGKSLCAHAVRRSLQAGLFLSVIASLVVSIFQYPILSLFTSNVEIKQEAMVALPLFLLAQRKCGPTFGEYII
jgi:Na+-driven multidrug efflux pump